MILRRSLAAMLCALLASSAVRAGDDDVSRPPALFFGFMDNVRLTNKARAALQNDRVLRPLKLVVVVKDGVAEVSGPVPSAQVADMVVGRLKVIEGIHDVRQSFHLKPEAGKTLVVAPPVQQQV